MLLEMAVLGSMLNAGGQCEIVQEYWSVYSTCVDVDAASFTVGEMTLRDVIVQTDDFTTAAAPAGQIGFSFAPEVDSGYYEYGVIPACREGGVLRQAGGGGGSYQPNMDGYHARKNSDEGFLAAFNTDPCIFPAERVVIVTAGYSEFPPVDPADVGWTNGATWNGITFSADGTYNATGTAGAGFVHLSQFACTGTFTGAPEAQACVTSRNWQTRYWTASVVRSTGVQQVAYSSFAWQPFYQNTTPRSWRSSDHYSFATMGTNLYSHTTVEVRESGTNALVWASTWYPEGHPLRAAASTGVDGKAIVVAAPGLDKFLYNPNPAEFEWMDGQCQDIGCVTAYCEGYGIDMVGFMGCLFAVDVDPLEWFQSLWENVQRGGHWLSAVYGIDLVQSYPRATVGMDGDCGVLFDLSGTPLAGLTGSTCDWPMPDTVRAISSAFLYIVAVFAVIKMVTRFMVEGHPGYFGFGERGESQGTLW